jgi:hypothetical protein
MEKFRYSAVITADPAEGIIAPVHLEEIELEYQPQLENIICLSTVGVERRGGSKSNEPYLLFVVDDIVLCDRLTRFSFNNSVLILRPLKKEFKDALIENLSVARRTTR